VGTQVQINGSGFGASQGTSTVSFSYNHNATITSWSDTQIVATVPSGATTGAITVTEGGVSSSSNPTFTVDTVLVNSVSPHAGSVGTQVTVNGSGFGASQGSSTLSFNNTVATSISSWTDSQIVATVPSGTTTGAVKVVNGSGTSNTNVNFTISTVSVNGVSPTSGFAGSQFQINGSGFGATQGSSTVRVNGYAATVVSWSNTQITVNDATSTYASGSVVVTVGSTQSNNDVTFTVTPPVVTSLSPTSGPVGTQVQINGNNFGATQGTSTITVNGVAASVNSWSNLQITATVPSTATSGQVTVTVGGASSTGNPNFTVPLPQVTSISPSSGSVGTQVTITGSGFQATRPASGYVFFAGSYGAISASIVSWNNTQIVATVPAGAITGGVQVYANVYSNGDVEFVMPAPTITGVSPSIGPVGTQVQVNGVGFGAAQGSSTVAFTSGYTYTNAAVVSWSDTQIVATVPSTATAGPVKVTNGGVASNTNVYYAVPAPQITNVSPSSGGIGTQFTITGSGFQATQGSSSVRVNNSACTVSSWSDTQIVGTIATGTSTGAVAVSVNGVTSNQNVQFAVPNLVITGLSPSSGPLGTQVQINGMGFGATQGTSTVAFAGTGSPTIVSWSDTQIVAVVPSTATSGPVKVTELGVTSNSNISFTVPTPQVSSISPTTGMLGTFVTVTGSGFQASQGTGSVTFNGTTAAIVSWSDTSILATVPANAGTGSVQVHASGAVSNPNVIFTMNQAHITNIVPPYGKPGTQVTIMGSGFGPTQGGASVSVAGVGAGVSGWSGNAVNAVIPEGPGGQVVIGFPDGGQSDGNPAFSPCSNGEVRGKPLPCVTSLSVYPTVVSGSQPVTVTFTASMANVEYWVPPGRLVMATSPGPIHPCIAPATDNDLGCYVTTDSATMQPTWNPAGFPSGVSKATLGAQIYAENDPGAFVSVTLIGDGTPNGTPELPCGSCRQAPPPTAGQPIDLMTGNTFIQRNDYSLPGLGGGITLSRTWNSQWSSTNPIAVAGMFGDSWRSIYEERIQTTSSGVNYWQGNGQVWRFALNAGVYTITSPAWAYGSLSQDSTSHQYTLTLPEGTKKTFNGTGYLSQIIDRNGNTTSLTYDSSNHITQVTDAANRTLTFAYGGSGNPNQVATISDPAGTIATYQYDASSRLTNVTYADNSQLNYGYDSNSLITQVTDSLGKVLEAHTYDSQRRGLTSQKANGIELVTVSYPEPGKTHVVDSLGNTSDYFYTVVGETHALTHTYGSTCASCSYSGGTLMTFDSSLNVNSRFDPNGHPTVYTYDANGNVLTRSTLMNTTQNGVIETLHWITWTYTYNSFNQVTSVTDPLGHTTTNGYDGNGNLFSVTTPSPDGSTPASVTTFGYDTHAQLTTITDPLNHVTTLAYYPTGLLHTITDAQNNVTTYAYDARGNRTSVVDAANQTTLFQYDAGNRLTQITNPDQSIVKFAYDTRGRRSSATDGNNKVTTYAYDDGDRLTSVTDAGTNVTQYGYDTESHLTSIADANQHATGFQYDSFGRVTQTTFPSTLVETYHYDNVGNLTSKTDRNNQTIQYAYDPVNRLVKKTYPDSTHVIYTYDDADRLTQVQDPTGTYGLVFDNMGRLKQTTTSYSSGPTGPYSLAYGYDAASNRTSLTLPDSSTDGYQYDTLNRLTTITDSVAGAFTFGYDALSRRTQLTRPNTLATTYAYDSVSNLQSVLHKLGVNTLDGASYTYDSAGNRKSKTNLMNGAVSNFAYDNIYQLTGVTGSSSESYTYDPVGNRLSSLGVPSYSYNNSNQLTSTSAASFTYDNSGNTLTKSVGVGTTTYTWDFENRLISAQTPSQGTVTFKYDPFGRRIQKSSSSGTTNYLYDGMNAVEEVDASGNEVARYAQDAGLDAPLAQLRSGTTSYYEQDGLGSITSVSGNTGTLANTYTYDAFGNLTASTGSLGNPFQYTGRDFDPETGLRYYRARYYDSGTGRFLNEDPSSLGGGLNLYRYVDNNVLNAVDPYGLAKCYLWFVQGKGWLYCVPDNTNVLPLLIPVASGNNGGGERCKNTHNCDDVSGQGAIPSGGWTWGAVSASHANKGGKHLIPDPGTIQDRTGILTHWCANPFSNRTPSPGHKYCSEGCVTGTEDDILLLNQILDAEPKSKLFVYGPGQGAPFRIGK